MHTGLLSLPAIAAGSFVVAFSGAVMPGPLLTLTISESRYRGMWAGPLLVLGHGLLEMLMVTALLLGLGPFLQRNAVAATVAITGALVLIGMAFALFKSIPGLRVAIDANSAPPRGCPVVVGMLMSIANPYWTIWWASIGLAYLSSCRSLGLPGVLAFFIGHIMGDLVWYAAVSWSFSRGQRFLNDTVYKSLIALCGAALVFFALWFARDAVVRVLPLLPQLR